MKKIRLDLDALSVDSFNATPDVPGFGTVGANASIETDTCIGPSCRRCYTDTDAVCGTCAATCATCDPSCVNTCGTCPGMYSCDASCNGTCDNTCYDTCAGNATCGGGYTCYDSCTCPI